MSHGWTESENISGQVCEMFVRIRVIEEIESALEEMIGPVGIRVARWGVSETVHC